MSQLELIIQLRELIVESAPDSAQAAPVRECGADDLLDGVIPFSSVIVLGTVIAVEDRFDVRITQQDLARAFTADGITLRRLAAMVEALVATGDGT